MKENYQYDAQDVLENEIGFKKTGVSTEDMSTEGILERNRIIALQNEDMLAKKLKEIDKKTSREKMNFEFFIDGYSMFGGVLVSKHADSDYVNINFLPNNEGKTISIYMTEKSYLKLWEVIDVFKIKSINTRQFEEQ